MLMQTDRLKSWPGENIPARNTAVSYDQVRNEETKVKKKKNNPASSSKYTYIQK